jgi:hypothetical protein
VAFARLEDLQARLPTVPGTFADLIMLAELRRRIARSFDTRSALSASTHIVACRRGHPGLHPAGRAARPACRSHQQALIESQLAWRQRRLWAAYCPRPAVPPAVASLEEPNPAEGVE